MQQCVNSYPLQEKAEFAFNTWRKTGIAQEGIDCKDLILSRNDRFQSTLEAEAGVASIPNSISGSVISSSNFCGVQGATISAIASSGNTFNAHNGVLNSSTSPLIDSHSSGSSMLCGSFSRQGDSQMSSNSQSAQSSDNLGMIPGQPLKSEHQDCITWSRTTSTDGPQGSTSSKPMNPNSVGAKSAVSEPHSLQATTSQHSMSDLHPPHPDMQANVQKIDSTQRYDIASSHSTSCIGNNFNSHGNGTYRNMGGNNGAHSNNSQLLTGGAAVDSNGSHNQNSFGAQYNSSANRAKNQGTGCENNSCSNSNSPYSGWQSLNAAVSSSSSSSWNIPEGNQAGRSCHINQSNSSTSDNPINDIEETMIIDNDIAYSGLIGATGGSEFSEENRQTGSSVFREGVAPWGLNHPRIGLLGGGETSINSGSPAWGGQNSGGGSSTASWGSNNRQQSGSASTEVPGNANTESVDNEISYTGLVGATGGSDYMEGKQSGNFRPEPSRAIPPPRMGLLGGGESSLTSGPSGWGGSGTSVSGWGGGNRQGSSTSEMPGNSSTGMSPPKPHNSWAQAAGKGLNTMPNTTVSSSQNSNVSSESSPGQSNVSSATKPRGDDQMNELKVKAAFSEGWGQTTVNQETPWDVPHSPSAPTDPSGPKENSSVWRQAVNNGTEIWETNLKLNKGVTAPAATTSTPPWGHTPATNIGGHWGDDDNSNNTWSGAPSANTGNSANWGTDGQSTSNHGSNMWNNPVPNEKHWGNQSGGPAWNEGGGPDNGTSAWNQPSNKQRNVGNWSPVHNPKKELQPSGWEQPSPPTGRRPMQNYDDGTSLWGNPSRQGKVSHWKDMPPAKPIINSGNSMGPASGIPPVSIGGGGMPPTGPGMIRLPTGATVNSKGDMQASVWNKPSPLNRGNNWNEMPPPRDSPNIGNWGDDSIIHNQVKNIPGTPNAPGSVFGSSWGEQTSPLPYWSSKPKGSSNWADGQVDTSTWLGPSKQGGKPLTRDLIWASKQFRLLIEMGVKKDDAENVLRNNNMSFEESLAELRIAPSLDGSMMEAESFSGRKVRPGNMGDDLPLPEHVLDPSFGSNSFHGSGSFHSPGNFQAISSSQGYKQPKNPGLNGNNATNLLNTALGGQQSHMNSISNVTPTFVHKLLQQQQQLQSFASNPVPQNVLGNQGTRVGQNNFPSAAQLRHLVQQIQMAVQAGHLNPQILNQPLAPQTLQLLYQLLQQIKVLHQLQQHQIYPNPHLPKQVPGAPNNSSGLQLNVQITQTKQRIMNLQNQIAAQQAVFLKNQLQQQSHQPLHTATTDIFKQNMESVPALQQDFRDLSLKDLQTQSRLNQWKLPSYEKEESSLCSSVSQSSGISSNNNSFNNDFSRAPGPLPSKTTSASSALPNPGPNLHPLLSQGDSAWSSLSRNQGDSGWPDSSGANDNSSNNGVSNASITSSAQSTGNGIQATSENKEQSPTPPSSGPSTSSASHTSYTDLVPEFEPGKPWKGTPLKNVEDDPHITPGSITRSPLSLNTIKDSDLFNWSSKSSPATTGSDTAGTLTSSTWVFTPPTAAVANSCSSGSSKPGNAKSNWGSLTPDISSGSDLWNSPVVNKTRCPPPGIPGQGWDRGFNSSFLLLRNLTPQIDGSTLKTLCMQHGPLQLFHLSLNHGIALVRYNTREEAAKAQLSLNNCVLGNTTILSDIPSDVEIHHYLNVLANQSTGGNMGWPTTPQGSNTSSNYRGNGSTYSYANSSSNSMNSGKLGSSAWNENMNITTSQLWSFSNSPSALWGNSQSINDHDQSTSSTLNSFLPGDLLGGESNVI